jgi:predicted Zn-dependent peptidase
MTDRLTIPGPHNIITGQLSNGLQVWVYENFESQTISLEGFVPGGSINETPEQAGLAHLTSIMLRRGTLKHDFDVLNETSRRWAPPSASTAVVTLSLSTPIPWPKISIWCWPCWPRA